MPDKLISFIIPHKGREEFLKQTLESILDQNFDLNLLEVIVVTQNIKLSGDINAIARKISLLIFTKPVTDTISALRNYGVEKSCGKFLAFLDADIKLSENWVSTMIKCLEEDKSRVLASAVQTSSPNATPLEYIRTALSNAVTDENVNFLPGRNLFLEREIFVKSGGFPEHLITCEDYYFTDQVNRIGNLYYTSGATYVHLGEDKNYLDMYKKEIWRGQSNLISIKGRRIPLVEIPSFIVPIALVLLLTATLFSLVFGYYQAALINFCLFVIPFLVYSVRLYSLSKNLVKFGDVIKFYLLYFPARAIGTIAGLFKTFSIKSHGYNE